MKTNRKVNINGKLKDGMKIIFFNNFIFFGGYFMPQNFSSNKYILYKRKKNGDATDISLPPNFN